ncbi:MAG: RNA methyltransferase [Thermoanaerobaculia bacterium]|nr:RNA methyltransferase [Thermoanaerobaculia bacterium]
MRRSKGDRALLEGPHLVLEAIAAGLALEAILVTPDALTASADGRRLGALLAARGTPVDEVSEELLASLGDADAPRGVLAVARLPRPGLAALRTPPSLAVFVDGLQDPGNLGALARVAEAAEADALVLAPGTVHPNHPRALRASAGSLLRLPVATGVTAQELAGRVPDATWVALVPRDGIPLWSADLTGPLVVTLGAEGPGLDPEFAARCDQRVTIPLAPAVESLNATVAAALVLFEIRRRYHPSQ